LAAPDVKDHGVAVHAIARRIPSARAIAAIGIDDSLFLRRGKTAGVGPLPERLGS
jgi:hypothetical protein